jgi:hypothetical protein
MPDLPMIGGEHRRADLDTNGRSANFTNSQLLARLPLGDD